MRFTKKRRIQEVWMDRGGCGDKHSIGKMLLLMQESQRSWGDFSHSKTKLPM